MGQALMMGEAATASGAGPAVVAPRLPILSIRHDLVTALSAGGVVLLAAPTGSGKSTQAPQFLLDAGVVSGQILVLQPRRLAARMLAARVAAERGQAVGGEVGYQTRFDSRVSETTRIRFITEGILPRLLMADPALTGIGAVVFDEFHERSLTVDMGLALVRQVQQTRRPDLRVLVMSATLDTAALRAYLPEARELRTEGRLYPVEIRYEGGTARLPVWERAAEALAGLLRSGADGDVLMFMPGAYEIRRTLDACRARLPGMGGPLLLPLYGDLPPEQQDLVMRPADRRKVIVATNIAETSLTIPGVRHVIDSGLARVGRHDAGRGFNTLFVESISRAGADQRAGRAGREGPGKCIRLWSQLEQNHRPAHETAEVGRVDLAEAVLLLHILGFHETRAFPWFETPPEVAVDAAERELRDLGVLDAATGRLTDLGRRLAQLPAHPRLARLLDEASRRGCLREATLVAALLSERAPAAPPHGEGAPSFRRGGTDEPASDFTPHLIAASHYGLAAGEGAGAGPAARQPLARTQAHFLKICRHLHWPVNFEPASLVELAKCLLTAYPDRLARRRDHGTLTCGLRDGRRGELVRDSLVRDAPLLVAAEIRETGGGGQGPRVLLGMATEVREEWLRELYPNAWREESELVWNEQERVVERRRRRSVLGVVLDESQAPAAGEPAAGALLAAKIRERGLPFPGRDEAVEAWLDRVRWVAEHFPERGLILYDDTDLAVALEELCAGEWRYERLKNRPLLPLLREMLSWDDRQFIERMAPEQLPLPSGRRMRLRYRPGHPARGNARIQDLFGLDESPRVAGNRERVLLEILAPNQRPVQITEDLAGFWRDHYPAIKKTLSRRYPRHQWW